MSGSKHDQINVCHGVHIHFLKHNLDGSFITYVQSNFEPDSVIIIFNMLCH